MTIQLELDPGMEARLLADAQDHGVAPETYLRQLLYNAISDRTQTADQFSRAADEQEIQSFLDAFASRQATPAHLPGETFSREMIYGEHD